MHLRYRGNLHEYLSGTGNRMPQTREHFYFEDPKTRDDFISMDEFRFGEATTDFFIFVVFALRAKVGLGRPLPRLLSCKELIMICRSYYSVYAPMVVETVLRSLRDEGTHLSPKEILYELFKALKKTARTVPGTSEPPHADSNSG